MRYRLLVTACMFTISVSSYAMRKSHSSMPLAKSKPQYQPLTLKNAKSGMRVFRQVPGNEYEEVEISAVLKSFNQVAIYPHLEKKNHGILVAITDLFIKKDHDFGERQ